MRCVWRVGLFKKRSPKRDYKESRIMFTNKDYDGPAIKVTLGGKEHYVRFNRVLGCYQDISQRDYERANKRSKGRR